MEAEVKSAFDEDGGVATVTLNRAAKLNALNLNMIRLLHSAVDAIESRSGKLSCLVMDGAGGKAFCAGGDVSEVRAEAMAGGTLPADFFYEEYAVVYRLATLFERTGCCQVSLWDGITMGGGVGLSAHGPIRVATEKTVFAKPEMSIGLFPDVGSTYKLSRLNLPTSVGVFIGCTGSRLTAWDCMRSGLATHYVPSSSIPKLQEMLKRRCTAGLVGLAARDCIEEILREVSAGAAPSPKDAVLTDEHLAVIERCFSAPTVKGILSRLQEEPGHFAKATLETMLKSCSPTSCAVTLKAIHDFAAPDISIGHVLTMEYRLAQRFTTRPQPHSDFYEGIRAVLIDKDRKQNWQPGWSHLDQVTDEKVATYFSPLEIHHSRGELALSAAAWSEKERKPFPQVVLKSKL